MNVYLLFAYCLYTVYGLVVLLAGSILVVLREGA